jgi:hypothetical protein
VDVVDEVVVVLGLGVTAATVPALAPVTAAAAVPDERFGFSSVFTGSL